MARGDARIEDLHRARAAFAQAARRERGLAAAADRERRRRSRAAALNRAKAWSLPGHARGAQPAPGRPRAQRDVPRIGEAHRGRERTRLPHVAGVAVAERPASRQGAASVRACVPPVRMGPFRGHVLPGSLDARHSTLRVSARTAPHGTDRCPRCKTTTPSSRRCPIASLDQLFRQARTYNALHRRGRRRHAAPALRPAEVGPDHRPTAARRGSCS